MNLMAKLAEMGADLSTRKTLKTALKVLGVEPSNVDRLYVDIKNSADKDLFRNAEPSQKVLFLPQCLRDPGCKARLESHGYRCVKCNPKCKARLSKEIAEELGYSAHIVPGGSMVAKIVEEKKPKAVAGVACMKELTMAFEGLDIPAQGIELLKDGCLGTDVDLVKLRKTLESKQNIR